MERITAAISLLQSGDRDGARSAFTDIWVEIAKDGDPFHRCTLAHYMADAQDDHQAELMWDIRALAAADSLTDDRVKAHHASLQLKAFYPSLHLNLAADYRKLGDQPNARAHIVLARQCVETLPDDGYGNLIRGGIDRLNDQLDAYPDSPDDSAHA
ncbi:MAG: hypothetical protein H7338_19755 [Candidatus Sericytochromatia bacterium]|nr:hypothetical protein [Candidatus Sericytochromatia bacterium]